MKEIVKIGALALVCFGLSSIPSQAHEVKISTFITCLTDRIVYGGTPLKVAIRGGTVHDDHITRAVRDWAHAMEGASPGNQFHSDVEISHSNVDSGVSYENSTDDPYWDACLKVEIVDSLHGTRLGEAFEFSTSSVAIRLLRNEGYAIVAHEIGHVIGLGHSDDSKAIMFPLVVSQTGLNEDDIPGAHAIYHTHIARKKDEDESRKNEAGKPGNILESVHEKNGMKCIHDTTADKFWAEYKENTNDFFYFAFDGSEFKTSRQVCRKMVDSFSGHGVCVPGLSDRKWWPHDVKSRGSLSAFVALSFKRNRTDAYEYQACVDFVKKHGDE